MSLNSSQVIELTEKSGYKAHVLNYLDDYVTKCLFMPEALKQLYDITIDSENDSLPAQYALDNRLELAPTIARTLAVSTDVLDLGKEYSESSDLLADLKTDVLKPIIFRLLQEWLPVFHQNALRRQAEIQQTLEDVTP